MSNLIPFPGKWKGASRAPNDARCCSEARAVACGNCSSHWICSWHGDRHSPEFIEPPLPTPTPRMDTARNYPPGVQLGPDECLACGKFDACTCEDCPSCEGRGYPGELTGVGRGGQGACPDCKGAGRIPSA